MVFEYAWVSAYCETWQEFVLGSNTAIPISLATPRDSENTISVPFKDVVLLFVVVAVVCASARERERFTPETVMPVRSRLNFLFSFQAQRAVIDKS